MEAIKKMSGIKPGSELFLLSEDNQIERLTVQEVDGWNDRIVLSESKLFGSHMTATCRDWDSDYAYMNNIRSSLFTTKEKLKKVLRGRKRAIDNAFKELRKI